MPRHIIFFTCALSFLSGIVYASLGLTPLLCIIPSLLAAIVLYVWGTDWKIALCAAALVVAGGAYYAWDDARYIAKVSSVPQLIEVEGVVSADPVRTDTQTLYLQSEYGKLRVVTTREEEYAYGDRLLVQGAIESPPTGSFGAYLAKEHVVASLREPRIELVAHGQGSALLSYLYSLKHRASAAFQKYLPQEKAAFLAGITLGINADFSEEFLEALSLSGTRHLTAISGQNFSIMIFVVFGMFSYLFSRRTSLALTYALMALFVALIGFQVSAIRALIMAFIVQLAQESGRTYAPYNALALSALVFALINPKVPVYDIGFQLSFLAVFAIIYLVPIAATLTRIGEKPGLLGWRQAFLTTLCAQVMTAPILITQFHNFSLTAVIANVLVLEIIPPIMILGFALAMLAPIFPWLAYAVSIVLAPLVEYAFLVIHAGAQFSYLFDPEIGLLGVAVYYGEIVLLMYWYHEWRTPPRAEGLTRLAQQKKPDPAREELAAEAGTYRLLDDNT